VRIVSLNPDPIHEVCFLNAARRPGAIVEERLPILEGRVAGLPDGLDALVITSDLQGRETLRDAHGQPPRLLGEVLPDRLADEWLADWGFPPSGRIGVLLAGDFYTETALEARGGIGDVTEVWQAFGRRFAWVAGVAGNHDAFSAGLDDLEAPPRFDGNLHFLDGDRRRLGGLRLAGVSGIVGNPRKPWRRIDSDYLCLLEVALEHETDILVLHDGPDAPALGHKGSAVIRELIERRRPRLVVRGHDHWPQPLVELPGGVQVLNVDCRVVVLRRAE